jgi:hypothetical protein
LNFHTKEKESSYLPPLISSKKITPENGKKVSERPSSEIILQNDFSQNMELNLQEAFQESI